MPADIDVQLDGAREPTPAVSDNEAPSTFVSLFGPFRNKKRKLTESRAEYLRENLSLVESSSRTLGLSGAAVVTDCEDDQPGEGPSSTDGAISVESSIDTPRSLTVDTTPTPPSSSRAVGAASHHGLAPTANGPTLEGMRVFNQGIDEETNKRFYDICEQLEPALVSFLQKKRVEFRPLSIQILVLGVSSSAVKPWIVVRCGKHAIRKARSFFKNDFATSLCQGPPSCRVRFDVLVTTQVQLKNSESPDEVFFQEEQPEILGAWAPCIKVEHSGRAHYATMGGLVCVTHEHGTKTFYGLTAGHILPVQKFDEYIQPSSSEDNDEDSTDEESDAVSHDDSDSDGRLMGTEDVSHHHNPANSSLETVPDASNTDEGPHWATLGNMSKASYSARARNRDWALIDIAEIHSKPLDALEAADTSLSRAASARDERCVVNHSKSRLECVMSSLPARMLLPSGQEFVKMHILQLPENAVLPRGSSGSWIMNANNEAPDKVYGSLIATDSLGGLWTMPMTDILKDIQDELKAFNVGLSTYKGRAAVQDDAVTNYAVKIICEESDAYSSEDEWRKQHKTEQRSRDERKLFATLPEKDSEYSATTMSNSNSHSPETAQTGPSHHYEEDWASTRFKWQSSKSLLWHCGACGDGPYGGWQFSCQNCGYSDRA